MTTSAFRLLPVGLLCPVVLLALSPPTDPAPRTGPDTEKRFPPLVVPEGFRVTLFACDPLIEYPSAIARGPRAGSAFVAVDYLTGLGTEIVRQDEIRLVEDADGDGYADRATAYAGGFHSIQGLTFSAGTVYVMHAPLLTALRDTDGDGKADWRKDLVDGLGLSPEENPVRLHCANGIVMGHDNWLYLALGDHGCRVNRPEGDRLVLEGGGILRCRPDGGDLHVFAAGLRNIYDVALDDELNVFVRDNENDGGDYKIRVCHSFFGADHGYPYLYYEHPDEALPPLADLGLGSSAGGLCYREPLFPDEYRGNLFFCEWGRAVVRYRPRGRGSAFGPVEEQDFAAGAATDPYGFKPTDLAVQRDGSLLVADWADGQRPKRGRGRLYRIAPKEAAGKPTPPLTGKEGPGELIGRLDSSGAYARTEAQAALVDLGRKGSEAAREALATKRLGKRGRLHAVWVLALAEGQKATDTLLDLVRADPEVSVRAQAVRALADLHDPVITRHRLAGGRGDPRQAERLARLAGGQDVRVVREIVVAVGRLRWAGAPAWLGKTVTKPDPALAHAAMQTLRASDNWPAVLELLDGPDTGPVRAVALRAVAGQAEPAVVDGLIVRLATEKDPARRRAYAEHLSRVHRKPGPWVYWGYRPPPRPANSVSWGRTPAVAKALDGLLADPDRAVRRATLTGMQREKVPTRLGPLHRWLREEREPERVAGILQSVGEHPPPQAAPVLVEVVKEPGHAPANRLTALNHYVKGLDPSRSAGLLELAGALEDGPVLAEALRQVGRQSNPDASSLLTGKLDSPAAVVRAAAVEALAARRVREAGDRIRRLLGDRDPAVRRGAAAATGALGVRSAIGELLKRAGEDEPGVRQSSLDSLRRMKEPRVVPLAVAALDRPETHYTALQCLVDLGDAGQAGAVIDLARRYPSAGVLLPAVRALSRWGGEAKRPAERRALARAVAELQGEGGMAVRWSVTGPLAADRAAALVKEVGRPDRDEKGKDAAGWKVRFASGAEARVALGSGTGEPAGSVRLAYADLFVPEPTGVQFLATASAPMRVWLNGRLAYPAGVGEGPGQGGRFAGSLAKGGNRVLVEIASAENATLQVHFRRRSPSAERERLAQSALTGRGDVLRGRELFLNAEKSLCVKCHRLGDRGERIGPELTGIGKRFARIHLIESVLEPSLTVTPGFETLLVSLKDGRVLTGVKAGETADTLTLADGEGRKQTIAKATVEERQPQPTSTMPEGLEKRLSAQEFLDLIEFLVSQQ